MQPTLELDEETERKLLAAHEASTADSLSGTIDQALWLLATLDGAETILEDCYDPDREVRDWR